MSDAKDLVRRFHETVWTAGRLDLAGDFLATDLVDHDALDFPGRPAGAAGLLAVVAMIRGAIPNLSRDIEAQFEDGDVVVTRFVDHGTHAGELLGVGPTGRSISIRGINIERVRGGRIVELWHLEDLAGLMSQIRSD